MATIFYKKFFEVRILHEYYLRDSTHTEFFALDEPDREAILTQKLRNQQYEIGKDLTIIPTAACASLLQGHHLRFVPQPTGFFMGIRVKSVNNQYVPYLSLAEDIHFTFILNIKNPYFKNITNDPLGSPVPSIYYFTNDNAANDKVFPALSAPVAAYQPGRHYAMGELAVIGGELMEAQESTDTPDPEHWKKVNATGLVHGGEKILLPKQFLYRFDRNKNVTTAAFILKTMENKVVKQISITQAERLDQVKLNLLTTNEEDIPDGFYQLEVTGDDNFQDEKKIYLSDMLYGPNYFGIVDIGQNNTNFRLLETDGSLRTPIPVFDIRLKSRSTYWRYISSEGKKFMVTPKTAPYLNTVQGALQSKVSRPLSFMPTDFRKDDPAVERVFLPNPPSVAFRPEIDGRVYSYIYTSPIQDLIAEDI